MSPVPVPWAERRDWRAARPGRRPGPAQPGVRRPGGTGSGVWGGGDNGGAHGTGPGLGVASEGRSWSRSHPLSTPRRARNLGWCLEKSIQRPTCWAVCGSTVPSKATFNFLPPGATFSSHRKKMVSLKKRKKGVLRFHPGLQAGMLATPNRIAKNRGLTYLGYQSGEELHIEAPNAQ